MGGKSALDSSRPIIAAGTRLNSIYEIDEPIATGGMGEVYRGHAIQTGDPVAIKLIRSDLNEAEAAFALFRKEAAALHNLYHEAIVRYYVFTVDPVLERPYLAMEFVDGQSLSAILREGPLSCEAVHSLMVRVASGLQAAHAQSIIHRDISPDNIIVPGGDMKRAKIIDFGIARSTRLDSGATIIGAGFAGKYNYVSPEQLGLFGGDVTPRSDIYSLGLVLAEALRQKPIDMGGSPAEVIEKRRKVPDLTGIDARMRPLIERMLQPNPKDRPQSMAEVAAWPLAAKALVEPTKVQPAPPRTAPNRTASNKTASNKTAASGKGASSETPSARTVPPTRRRTRDDKPLLPINATTVGLAIALAIGASFGLYRLLGSSSLVVEEKKDQGQQQQSAEDKIEGTTRFVMEYPGGPCFYVKPLQITDNSALLEGYGVTTAPFSRLDTAFRDKAGFEADIGVHEIAAAQCPAIALLGTLQNAQAAAPKIALSSSALKLGQDLVGIIRGIAGRQVDLLLVADDGTVRLLTSTPYPSTEEKMPFRAKLGPELANGKLQLLVAIASPKPMSIIPNDTSVAADKFFPRVLADAKTAGLSLVANASSFRLDK